VHDIHSSDSLVRVFHILIYSQVSIGFLSSGLLVAPYHKVPWHLQLCLAPSPHFHAFLVVSFITSLK
jgi:hypothetical protein